MNAAFWKVAESVHHPGMGTENVGMLLYAVTKMLRPPRALAVGLGYTTLFLLQALADAYAEARSDYELMQSESGDAGRREILHDIEADHVPQRGRLVALDDFSDDGGRLTHMLRCISHLGLDVHLELHRARYDEGVLERQTAGFQLAWVDCGHQLDYAELTNRIWSLIEGDGMLGVHYTYVDVVAEVSGGRERIVIPGPWLNAVKRQQLSAGLDASFELLSLVEPHKFRQGSLTLLRKNDATDRCRATSLAQEQSSLYGTPGQALVDLNEGGAGD